MAVEGEAQRFREERRKELIERLNSEEQPPSREEIEERERRAEDAPREPRAAWLFLAAWSSLAVVLGMVASIEVYIWLPPQVALWVGALLTYVAFRYLGWGRTVARTVCVASLVGELFVLLGIHFLVGSPLFSLPVPAIIAYGAVLNLLIGAGVIAGATAKRLSYEECLP